MKQSQINWRRGDYVSLGKAVSEFNRKINELNAEERKLYLPETLNYKEVKENITTRSELNRIINSLRRFKKQGAEELYITQAGEELTKWERRELGIQSGIIKRRLKKEIKELNEPKFDGFSRAQMGSDRLNEIEDELKSLENIEFKKGYEFNRLKNKIRFQGTSDYTLQKASIFRENFMVQLEDLKNNLSEFEKVYDYFNTIKNPISFFNETQKSNALQDFFIWYKTPEAYAGFSSTQELADYIIEQYKKE